MKKYFKLAIKILISAAFISWLVFKVDWVESWQYLKRIEFWQIIVYVSVILFSLFISAKKWQKLCLFKNFKNSFLDYFKLYLTGAFINNFVPSTIGGDIFRAYQIGKKEGRHKEATSAVVADRFTGLLALMLMSVLFFLLNFSKTSGMHILVLANLVIILALVIFVVFYKIRKTTLIKKIMEYFPKKVADFLRELIDFGSDRKIFFQAIFFSFMFNLIGVGFANLILFWSLGIDIKLLDYFSVIFLISIISSLPAGVGLKEWAYITFFAPLGIDISGSVMVAILNRFLQGLVNILALPIYLKKRNLKR